MTIRNGNTRTGQWQHDRIRASKKHAHHCKTIEDLTKHRVSIKTTAPSNGKINPQQASRFMRLPAEIRIMIYQLALNETGTTKRSKAVDGGPAV
jgi:hypothetical protein